LLPPHTYQALVIAESKSEQNNKDSLLDLKNYLEAKPETYCQISDPMPRVLQRLSGQERNQILIESTNRQAIQAILERALDYIESMKKNSRSIKFNIDRDPIQF
jgi:primosomal protein N' (replication factor Y)